MNKIEIIFKILIIILLIISLFPDNSYEYYIILKWVCFPILWYFTSLSSKKDQIFWTWIFGIAAFLYNPVLLLSFSRDIWIVLDISLIAFIFSSLFSTTTQKKHRFRVSPQKLSKRNAIKIEKNIEFYFTHTNLTKSNYKVEVINGQKVLFDELTGLMWQYSNSFLKDQRHLLHWIEDLNREGYAGYYDWRIPTLEEAITLKVYMNNKISFELESFLNDYNNIILTADRKKGKDLIGQ